MSGFLKAGKSCARLHGHFVEHDPPTGILQLLSSSAPKWPALACGCPAFQRSAKCACPSLFTSTLNVSLNQVSVLQPPGMGRTHEERVRPFNGPVYVRVLLCRISLGHVCPTETFATLECCSANLEKTHSECILPYQLREHARVQLSGLPLTLFPEQGHCSP